MARAKKREWLPGTRVEWAKYWEVHPPVGVGQKHPPPARGVVGSFDEPRFWAGTTAMGGCLQPSEAAVRLHVEKLRADGYLQGLVPLYMEGGRRCMAPDDELCREGEGKEARSPAPAARPKAAVPPKKRRASAAHKDKGGPEIPGLTGEWREVPL